MKNQFKRTCSLSVFAGTTGRLSTGSQLHELPCVSVCVCLSVCLTDCVILRESAGVDSRHLRGVCFMCIYIYFRGMNGKEWHTRTEQGETEREKDRARLVHPDWVQPIIQYHEGAETPGIDSQAKGQQDRQMRVRAHTHSIFLRMIHADAGCGHFETLLF